MYFVKGQNLNSLIELSPEFDLLEIVYGLREGK